jgi:Putative rhamnosyl transferase
MTAQHFLLTRFNIASPGRESAIRNAPGWLERRFALFEAYCLPSIAAQTTRDFAWLIYFDPATPEAFHERIAIAQQSFPFEARFVESFSAEMVAQDVAERLNGSEGTVLTTRLDNDDAVSRDFLERVRTAAEAQPFGTVLNFPHGIALREGRLFTAYDTSNPFTTLIENATSEVQTIWSAQHRDLGTRWKLVQVASPPVWLQVVHGENVANRIKGALVDAAHLPEGFAIAPEVPLTSTSRVALVTDRLAAHPLRWLRERAISLAKFLRDGLRR